MACSVLCHAGLNPAHAPSERAWSAPVFDGHLRAGMNFDGIGAEHIDDHFEVAWIADFENRRARLHHRFALLCHFENEARKAELARPS